MQNREDSKTGHRRRFLKRVGGLGLGLAAGGAVRSLSETPVEAAPPPPVLTEANGNLIVRMQRELEQALDSGATPSWLMVVDTRKCIGCNACTVACRAENPTGPGTAFRRVVEIRLTPGHRPISIFKPFNCLQCDAPPCQRAVPPGAITKRPDGIVEFDYLALKGSLAERAVAACPFGAAHIDPGTTHTQDTPAPQPYEERPFVENGVPHARIPGQTDLAGSARKCTFCSHRLAAGLLPACVVTCLGGAMYFGDANDPDSLVMEVTQGRRVFQGHANFGVEPRVIYFTEPMPDASFVDCSVCHI
ncbi:MAG: hypothetical protein Kow001_24680 [Acidobacteriota bacterium]